VSGGDHCWFERSTGKKRPVTETSISYDDDDNNNYNNYYHCYPIIIYVVFDSLVPKNIGR